MVEPRSRRTGDRPCPPYRSNSEVQVIKLMSRGTIEEKMNELQVKKKHLIREMIDDEEHTTSTMTEEDIRELLKI